MNTTRDTYIVHDYFLHYSPILLAATSVHLCLRTVLGNSSFASSMTEDERTLIEQVYQKVSIVFNTQICDKIAKYQQTT